MGTIKEKDYFRDVWLFKKDISLQDIKLDDGEVVNAAWTSIEKYKELLEKNIVVPNGGFVYNLINKDLEVER